MTQQHAAVIPIPTDLMLEACRGDLGIPQRIAQAIELAEHAANGGLVYDRPPRPRSVVKVPPPPRGWCCQSAATLYEIASLADGMALDELLEDHDSMYATACARVGAYVHWSPGE